MDNIAFVACCLYFCYRSFCDFQGYDQSIKEEYRNLPGRERWQKRRAISEAVIGIGAILFLPLQGKTAAVLIGAVVFASFVFMIINNKNYIKQRK